MSALTNVWLIVHVYDMLLPSSIKLSGASSMKDMGKVMGILKSKNADTLDFSKVSSIIKDLLK